MATWNTAHEATPAGSDNASTIDDKIREDKIEVRVRGDREHSWLNTTQATGGYHRAGSAKVYFTTATPANRPDGTVALDSSDKGRLWASNSSGVHPLRIYNGTVFTNSIQVNSALSTGAIRATNSAGTVAHSLKLLIVSIGSWNMDATGQIIVPIGAFLSNTVRSIDAIVREDTNWRWYNLQWCGAGGTYLASNIVSLTRNASGQFDGTLFNSTGFNRGWITIWHT